MKWNPEFTAMAHKVIEICVTPSEINLSGSNPVASTVPASATAADTSARFQPLFVHQMFPLEKIFGYKQPKLQIFYTDPDMRIAVVGSAVGVKTDAAVPDPTGQSGKLVRVAPDGIGACLSKALPEHFPVDQITTRLGPAASAPLTASELRFYPAAAEAGSGGGAGIGSSWRPFGTLAALYTVTPSSAGSGSSITRTFALRRWRISESPSARAYHDRVSTLSMWLIETASAIDTNDDRWTCFGLYEVVRADAGSGDHRAALTGEQDAAAGPSDASAGAACNPQQLEYRLAGYSTVYRFTNPLRKPRPDALRLAQLLIVPRYQRQGHGLRIMEAITAFGSGGGHAADAKAMGEDGSCVSGCFGAVGAAVSDAISALASSSASSSCSSSRGTNGQAACLDPSPVDAHEISVESPCEGMTRLRDLFDIQRAYNGRVFAYLEGRIGGGWAGYGGALSGASADGGATSTPAQPSDGGLSLVKEVTDLDVEAARQALRITTSQAHRCYEALLLARIDRSELRVDAGASAAPTVAGVGKAFRLLVKRRIFNSNPDIRAITDIDARKTVLEDRYRECEAEYMAALSRIRSTSGLGGWLVGREEAAASMAVWLARQAEIEAENKGDDDDGTDGEGDADG